MAKYLYWFSLHKCWYNFKCLHYFKFSKVVSIGTLVVSSGSFCAFCIVFVPLEYIPTISPHYSLPYCFSSERQVNPLYLYWNDKSLIFLNNYDITKRRGESTLMLWSQYAPLEEKASIKPKSTNVDYFSFTFILPSLLCERYLGLFTHLKKMLLMVNSNPNNSFYFPPSIPDIHKAEML